MDVGEMRTADDDSRFSGENIQQLESEVCFRARRSGST
jgi:hypothetical protein